MNCDEFELIGLGLDRESASDGPDVGIERRAAADHARTCSRCAALQESWREAQSELETLRDATQEMGAPLRVEMHLRQEFHTRHRTLKVRAAAVVAAWALAGAVLLVGAVSWWNWHVMQTGGAGQSTTASMGRTAATPTTHSALASATNTAEENNVGDSNDATLVAENDAEDFTLLPGSMPQETGDAAVVRVRMQRGALGALGLPLNETRAGEWIQVDLFVGQDGQPQAVRLPQ